MRLFITISLSFLGSCGNSHSVNLKAAPSVRSVFPVLPAECTPGLNGRGRKALVAASEDSTLSPSEENGVDYSIDTITDSYLAYEYTNAKEDGRHASYEIKRLKKDDGNYILLFSKNSDTRGTSNEYNLKIFDISDSALKESKENFLPQKLDYTVFLKKDAPDAIKEAIQKTSLCAFDLNIRSDNQIIFYITLEDDNEMQWLTGNIMTLTWNGSHFDEAISFEKK